jgi:hypothetical protein
MGQILKAPALKYLGPISRKIICGKTWRAVSLAAACKKYLDRLDCPLLPLTVKRGFALTASREIPPVVEYLRVDELVLYLGNARKHSKAQIGKIAASIERFGFNNPILMDSGGIIVVGRSPALVAKKSMRCLRRPRLSGLRWRQALAIPTPCADLADRPIAIRGDLWVMGGVPCLK